MSYDIFSTLFLAQNGYQRVDQWSDTVNRCVYSYVNRQKIRNACRSTWQVYKQYTEVCAECAHVLSRMKSLKENSTLLHAFSTYLNNSSTGVHALINYFAMLFSTRVETVYGYCVTVYTCVSTDEGMQILKRLCARVAHVYFCSTAAVFHQWMLSTPVIKLFFEKCHLTFSILLVIGTWF